MPTQPAEASGSTSSPSSSSSSSLSKSTQEISSKSSTESAEDTAGTFRIGKDKSSEKHEDDEDDDSTNKTEQNPSSKLSPETSGGDMERSVDTMMDFELPGAIPKLSTTGLGPHQQSSALGEELRRAYREQQAKSRKELEEEEREKMQ